MTDIGRTWSYGGIRIAVEHDTLDYPKYRFVEHNVLDTLYTDIQKIGSGEILRSVRGVIFSGYDQLLVFVGSGYHTLVSDQGIEDDYFLAGFQSSRLVATNYDTPVYRITITLKKELV